MRYLLFDNENLALFNHSSVQTEVTSSNELMVKVSLVEDTFQAAVENNNYDVRRL
jgi:hypothetical protein